jgi:hypothetical protein
LLIKTLGKKEENVFKIFANTMIIDFNHACKIKHFWKSVLFARILPTKHHLVSEEGKMAMLRIKVCMNIIFIVSDIYAHFLIPKITLNSPGHCLKKVVANEGQVRIRHTKPKIYRWRCSGKKSMEHRSGHILSVLSVYQRYFCIV